MRRRTEPSPPPRVPDRAGEDAVLGTVISGDLYAWVRRVNERPVLCYPAADLSRHGAVIGAAGSGKTETLLRLAHLARAVYGWRGFFLHPKGGPQTRAPCPSATLAPAAPSGATRCFP